MTSPELIAHIMKGGGRILVVGGETKDLPRQFHEHAQILIWDDNQQSLLNKEVPSNVRVIMWSRWISHTMVSRLNIAAKQLKALKFPMLRPREIKELLAEVAQTQEPPSAAPAEIIQQQIEQINQTNEPEFPDYVSEPEVKETTMAKSDKNVVTMKEFIAKHINPSIDYSVKGSKTKEGGRLFDIAKKEGFKSTPMSMNNAVSMFIRELAEGKSKPVKPTSVSKPRVTTGDDFEELEKLIGDAIVALKLVQEHMPKVRKETEKLRGLKAKFMKLLE